MVPHSIWRNTEEGGSFLQDGQGQGHPTGGFGTASARPINSTRLGASSCSAVHATHGRQRVVVQQSGQLLLAPYMINYGLPSGQFLNVGG